MIVEEQEFNTSDGSEKIRGLIVKFALQGPWPYRSKEAKVEYLYKAVSNLPWIKAALT